MDRENKHLLFNEFPGISTEAWEKKIKTDLKGADYRKKLITTSDDGIDIKPYYREEDLEQLPYLRAIPSLVKGMEEVRNWTICQDIETGNDPGEANSRIQNALKGGAGAIRMKLLKAKTVNKELISLLLKDVCLKDAELIFQGYLGADAVFNHLSEILSERGDSPETLKGCLGADPLGKMAANGIPIAGFDNLARLMKELKGMMPGMRLIDVHGSMFQEAGATLSGELAFTLSMACEYLSILSSAGCDPKDVCESMQVSMAVGPDYFMEIAKLRAFRILWDRIAEAFEVDESSRRILLHTSTSEWNLTLYDRHTNILRGTTGAMSAVLGGADLISVVPFDQPFGQSSAFSDRIARNVQIILRDEAHFGKVLDPASGSYYIESLTDQIAEKAWDLFRESEAKKGFRKALESGWIQNHVNLSRGKKLERAASGREHILGTNAYPDFKELIKNQLPEEKSEIISDTDIQPIRPFRLASGYEKLRMETEASGKRPRVFLFKHGNPAWASARATFSANFFACAGYEILDPPPVKSVDEGIKKARSLKADLVVLCSSDEAYVQLAPEVYENLEEDILFVAVSYTHLRAHET